LLAPSNYVNGFLWYLLAFTIALWPYLFEGKVIAPHRQALELALPQSHSSGMGIENRKFNDFFTVYVPEISQHLTGPRSTWLATWSPYNELGRPLYHSWGFSPAYPMSWVLTFFVQDEPLLFYKVLVLALIFVGGTFTFFLVRELELAPASAATAAILFATSPQVFYWLTFPMFISVLTWCAGLMLGLTQFARRGNLVGWSIAAFSAYSLLIMGYPQQVIFHLYFLAGWIAFLALRIGRQAPTTRVVRFLALSAAAGVVAVACALPIHVELAAIRAGSARTNVDPSFFLAVLPKVESLDDGLRVLVSLFAPEVLGNPISPQYPIDYDGRSVAPMLLLLASTSFVLVWKRVWALWIAVALCLILTFNHSLYLWAVAHLGFNISRSAPIVTVLLPLTLIAAHVIDAVLRTNALALQSRAAVWSVATLAVMLLCSFILARSDGFAVDWVRVTALIMLGASVVAFLFWPRPLLVVAPAIAATLLTAAPLRLAQAREEVHETSPLVEAIQRNLQTDERYALIQPEAPIPPNLNATLRLASIHTYNSLSALRYHAFIERLGGRMHTYGRHNFSIAPRFDETDFQLANIALILSKHAVSDARLAYSERVAGFWLYRVREPLGCCRRYSWPGEAIDLGNAAVSNPRLGVQVRKTLDLGDLLELEFEPAARSLVVVTQRYDRQWRAEQFRAGLWGAADTVPVNEVYQGVIVGEGSTKLRLQYTSIVRHAWIGHVIFGGLGLLSATLVLCKRLLRFD
jgi:hypothetical protein